MLTTSNWVRSADQHRYMVTMEMMNTSSMGTLPSGMSALSSGVTTLSPIEIKMEVDGIDYGNMPTPPGMSGEVSPGGSTGSGGRARKQKEDKICGVCGDRALGYNFDAISCESCKAFFRRNAPKGLEYFKCPYDEKCKMDISNRRFCKRCRLKKCFEIGMRKEYILTEEEKAAKRKKIEENRELERHGVYTPTTQPVTSSSLVHPLCHEDAMEVEELYKAYCGSLEINMEEEMSRDNASNMSDLVNIAEISVRRVIGMAKKVRSFTSLDQPDQIALLKGGSIELLILRSVITFDKEKQHFLDPFDKEDSHAMKLEQLQRAEGGLFEDHMTFVKSLALDLQADQKTLILLLVISLFSPDRPNLVSKDLVTQEQEKYSMLLKKYLESVYPSGQARALYPRLLMKLTDIRNLNEEHSQVLLKINPCSIQPLMQEVLDIRT